MLGLVVIELPGVKYQPLWVKVAAACCFIPGPFQVKLKLETVVCQNIRKTESYYRYKNGSVQLGVKSLKMQKVANVMTAKHHDLKIKENKIMIITNSFLEPTSCGHSRGLHFHVQRGKPDVAPWSRRVKAET